MPFDMSESVKRRGNGNPSNLFLSFEPSKRIDENSAILDDYYAMQVATMYSNNRSLFQECFPLYDITHDEIDGRNFKVTSSSLEERVRKLEFIFNPNEWMFYQFAALCPTEDSPLYRETELAKKARIDERNLIFIGFKTLDFVGCEYDKHIETRRREEYAKKFKNVDYFDPFEDFKI